MGKIEFYNLLSVTNNMHPIEQASKKTNPATCPTYQQQLHHPPTPSCLSRSLGKITFPPTYLLPIILTFEWYQGNLQSAAPHNPHNIVWDHCRSPIKDIWSSLHVQSLVRKQWTSQVLSIHIYTNLSRAMMDLTSIYATIYIQKKQPHILFYDEQLASHV